MNQGKLKVVKQKMAIMNIDILGISELKWTRMGELNSDDHYIYYCGQESLRRNGVALLVKQFEMQYLCAISKKTEWSLFQGKPFSITVIQVYAPTTSDKEAEAEQFWYDIKDLIEWISKKDVLFITGDSNANFSSVQ